MATCTPTRFSPAALIISICVSLLFSPIAASAPAAEIVEVGSDAQDFTIERVAGPFNHPWSIAFLPNNQLLVSERWGELKLVDPGTGKQRVVSGTPPRPREDHAGLMDVILDPGYEQNQTIYLTYAHGERSAASVHILKAQFDFEGAALENAKIIYKSAPPAPGLEEFGGRMVIDKDGYLFVSLGDRFDRTRAQKLSDAHGKIIRLHLDGSVPKDNPFVDDPNVRPEIWSFGHRNPQGLAIDSRTGKLWATEHGPMGGDELNIIERGKDYGWPTITYGTEYDGNPINNGRTHADGMEQPIHYWVPSIAPSGLTIYNGPVQEWQGKAWLGGLVGQALVRLTIKDNKVVREERFLQDQVGRIRDVRQGPDGFIYFSVDNGGGEIFKVKPKQKRASAKRQ